MKRQAFRCIATRPVPASSPEQRGDLFPRLMQRCSEWRRNPAPHPSAGTRAQRAAVPAALHSPSPLFLSTRHPRRRRKLVKVKFEFLDSFTCLCAHCLRIEFIYWKGRIVLSDNRDDSRLHSFVGEILDRERPWCTAHVMGQVFPIMLIMRVSFTPSLLTYPPTRRTQASYVALLAARWFWPTPPHRGGRVMYSSF